MHIQKTPLLPPAQPRAASTTATGTAPSRPNTASSERTGFTRETAGKRASIGGASPSAKRTAFAGLRSADAVPAADPSPSGRAQVLAGVIDELRALSSLEPGPDTNRLFGQLVGLTRDRTGAKAVLSDPALSARLPLARSICARGESALEHHWSKRVRESAAPVDALAAFPYQRNYIELVRLELNALLGVGCAPQNVLFIGSGPLPLSALELARQAESVRAIHCLDIDEDALRAGEAFANRFPERDKLSFSARNVLNLDAEALGKFDLVFVAALVGLSPEAKAPILEHLHAHVPAGTHVAARSAHGLRQVLYPKIKDLPPFRTLVEAVPRDHEVVNSVLIGVKDD